MTAERLALPGDTCTCGRPAVVVFVTERWGDVGWCGVPRDAANAAPAELVEPPRAT